MSEREWLFSETRIEERDGARWVSGVCPACGERVAFRAPPEGDAVRVRCANHHLLRIDDQRTAGDSEAAARIR